MKLNRCMQAFCRSTQAMLDKAYERCEITKEVSIHSLWYAVAAHLLEGGVDLHSIQELLGHASSPFDGGGNCMKFVGIRFS